MVKKDIQIINKLGLHARASVKLSKVASAYNSETWVSKGGCRVNAKSVMGVMMLAAGLGSTITIESEGEDAQEVVDSLVELVNDKFGEGE